jgi:hypothetical protein
MYFTEEMHGCSQKCKKKFYLLQWHKLSAALPRESGEEDRSATGLLLRTHSAALCLRTCYYLKARAGYALKPSMTRLHNAELVN